MAVDDDAHAPTPVNETPTRVVASPPRPQVERPPPAAVPQTTTPQPVAGPSRKRPLPTDHATRQDTTQPKKVKESQKWYEIGDEDEDFHGKYRWVRVEKCPGQRRIQAYMSDDEKLEIARKNQEIRTRKQQELAAQGIRIKYHGKHILLGVPDNGEFDEKNYKSLIAVLMAGTTRKSDRVLAYENEIAKGYFRTDDPLVGFTRPHVDDFTPPTKETAEQTKKKIQEETKEADAQDEETEPVTTLHITHLGRHFRIILYTSLEQLNAHRLRVTESTIKVKKQPSTYNMVITSSDRVGLWNMLSRLDNITDEERTDIYNVVTARDL